MLYGPQLLDCGETTSLRADISCAFAASRDFISYVYKPARTCWTNSHADNVSLLGLITRTDRVIWAGIDEAERHKRLFCTKWPITIQICTIEAPLTAPQKITKTHHIPIHTHIPRALDQSCQQHPPNTPPVTLTLTTVIEVRLALPLVLDLLVAIHTSMRSFLVELFSVLLAEALVEFQEVSPAGFL